VATSSVSDTPSRRWDRAGIAISTACAVHCAALPLVAGVLPVIGLHHFTDEWVEWLLIAITATIGVVGHVSAFVRHHRHVGPSLAFAASLGLIIGTRLTLGDTLLEPAALAIGGLTAAGAHWANIHLCRCCTRHQAGASADECVESGEPRGGNSTDCAG
jgi:hypothetical protein